MQKTMSLSVARIHARIESTTVTYDPTGMHTADSARAFGAGGLDVLDAADQVREGWGF